MNSLFYVAMYNHRRNEFARFLLTADTLEDAEDITKKRMDGWTIESIFLVCVTTDNDIFTDL